MIVNIVNSIDFKPFPVVNVKSAIRELKSVLPKIKKEHVKIVDIEPEKTLSESPELNQNEK